MPTGTPFAPALFPSTLVAPSVANQPRTLPYVSPSEYRFAPTAVSSAQLVSRSLQQSADSTASLAQVLARASSWVDILCFRGRTGDLAASSAVEQQYVSIRPDGGFSLVCNFRPVWEVTGLAVGPSPSAMSNVTPSIASDIYIEGKVIHVPVSWSTTPLPMYPSDSRNRVFAVWSYINGFPNFGVAGVGEIAKGVSSLALQPAYSGATTCPAIYAGTQLFIMDGGNTESVLATTAPNSLTVTLAQPTQFSHVVPSAPDFLRVTALPAAIEQATIHLASVLLKTQGSRALIMSGAPGGLPSTQAMSMSGSTSEYNQALELLKPFQTVYLHD